MLPIFSSRSGAESRAPAFTSQLLSSKTSVVGVLSHVFLLFSLYLLFLPTTIVLADEPNPGDTLSDCLPYTEKQCRILAINQKLQLGGCGYPFKGLYYIKGCYTYVSDHPCHGSVFYGDWENSDTDWLEKVDPPFKIPFWDWETDQMDYVEQTEWENQADFLTNSDNVNAVKARKNPLESPRFRPDNFDCHGEQIVEIAKGFTGLTNTKNFRYNATEYVTTELYEEILKEADEAGLKAAGGTTSSTSSPQTSSSTQETLTEHRAHQAKDLVLQRLLWFAFTAPLSGTLGDWNARLAPAVQMAVDDINKSGYLEIPERANSGTTNSSTKIKLHLGAVLTHDPQCGFESAISAVQKTFMDPARNSLFDVDGESLSLSSSSADSSSPSLSSNSNYARGFSKNIFSIIGDSCSTSCSAINRYAEIAQLLQIAHGCTALNLHEGRVRWLRTVPTVAASAHAAYVLLRDILKYRKFAFVTENNLQSKAAFEEFMHNNLEWDSEYPAKWHLLNAYDTPETTYDTRNILEVKNVVKHLKYKLDARVVLLSTDELHAALLFCQFYREKMFGQHVYLVIGLYWSPSWISDNAHHTDFGDGLGPCSEEQIALVAENMLGTDIAGFSKIPGERHELSGRLVSEIEAEYLAKCNDKSTNAEDALVKGGGGGCHPTAAPYVYDSIWSLAHAVRQYLEKHDFDYTKFATYPTSGLKDITVLEELYEIAANADWKGTTGRLRHDYAGDRMGEVEVKQGFRPWRRLIKSTSSTTSESDSSSDSSSTTSPATSTPLTATTSKLPPLGAPHVVASYDESSGYEEFTLVVDKLQLRKIDPTVDNYEKFSPYASVANGDFCLSGLPISSCGNNNSSSPVNFSAEFQYWTFAKNTTVTEIFWNENDPAAGSHLEYHTEILERDLPPEEDVSCDFGETSAWLLHSWQELTIDNIYTSAELGINTGGYHFAPSTTSNNSGTAPSYHVVIPEYLKWDKTNASYSQSNFGKLMQHPASFYLNSTCVKCLPGQEAWFNAARNRMECLNCTSGYYGGLDWREEEKILSDDGEDVAGTAGGQVLVGGLLRKTRKLSENEDILVSTDALFDDVDRADPNGNKGSPEMLIDVPPVAGIVIPRDIDLEGSSTTTPTTAAALVVTTTITSVTTTSVQQVYVATCSPCAKGFYSDVEGLPACKASSPGFYVPDPDVLRRGRELDESRDERGAVSESSFSKHKARGSRTRYLGKNQSRQKVRNKTIKRRTTSSRVDSSKQAKSTNHQTAKIAKRHNQRSIEHKPARQLVVDPNGNSINLQALFIEQLPCNKGSYQNLTGQTKCESCPVGTFQNRSGQPYCQNCTAGSYASEEGADRCKNFFLNFLCLSHCHYLLC